MIDSVWIVQESKQLLGGTDLFHFDLVPTLNRVGVVSQDLPATECVVAPIYVRRMHCCGTEKKRAVLGILRKEHDVTSSDARTAEVCAWHIGRIDDTQRKALRFQIIAQSTYLVLMAKIDEDFASLLR